MNSFNDITAMLEEADANTAKHDFQKAEDLYVSLIQQLSAKELVSGHESVNPFISALLGLAKVKRSTGIFKDAKPLLEQAIELFPKSEDTELKAAVYRQYGIVLNKMAFYTEAIHYLDIAEELSKELEQENDLAAIYSEKGGAYFFLSDYSKALEYVEKSLKAREAAGDMDGWVSSLQNMGLINLRLMNFEKAREYHEIALKHFESTGNDRNAATASNLANLGGICNELKDYPKALEYFKRSLSVFEELGDHNGIGICIANLGVIHNRESRFEEAIPYFAKAESMARETGSLRELFHWLTGYAEALLGMNPPNNTDAELKLQEALNISESQKMLNEQSDVHQKLAEFYRKQERWKEALEHFKQYHLTNQEINSLEAKKQADQFNYELEVVERDKADAIKRAVLEAKQNATESLLHKVMPQQIARRILSGEAQVADYYPNVSILFADIQGFTSMTSDLPPYLLLHLLHAVFSRFDSIVVEHACTKIKTIGDGYMVVAGAPEAIENHAESIVQVAMEMIKPIDIPAEVIPFLPDGAGLSVRVGIHSGPVVAGVVGEDRFGYDIFSDTVNIAAQMETNGEAGKVHVSSDFMRHLLSRFAMTKNQSHGLTFEKRGEIEVKGKGKMKTFFLHKE